MIGISPAAWDHIWSVMGTLDPQFSLFLVCGSDWASAGLLSTVTPSCTLVWEGGVGSDLYSTHTLHNCHILIKWTFDTFDKRPTLTFCSDWRMFERSFSSELFSSGRWSVCWFPSVFQPWWPVEQVVFGDVSPGQRAFWTFVPVYRLDDAAGRNPRSRQPSASQRLVWEGPTARTLCLSL